MLSTSAMASQKSDGSAGETLGDTLVPVINRLQDIFSQVTLDFKLELPQVAVIGSQSSGKSSVLEALVGRDFLPRGPDICTRRPLVLQLVKSSGANGPQQEWAEFLHCPGKRFFDDARIREEILAETARLTGDNKGISDKPIRLRITSPTVLTMTLVDLPGLARNPVGDQPADIEKRIRALVHAYIRHPTCLILAVSPANVDLANSDALEMARSVDPEGFRTIGVLTKLDIMDRGTDAGAVLRNEVLPLRLGHLGIVNRSQHDLNVQRTIVEARAAEAEFFASHPVYSEVLSQCGIPALAKTLNAILVDHIRALLPSLRVHLEESRDRRARELAVLGEAPPGHTSAARGALLLQLLDNYATRYSEMLDGRSEHLPVSELAGGARIRHIFQDIFCKGLDELNPSSELTDQDVRTAIKNSGGVKGSLLIPEAPFELLVRRAIQRLLTPALQCKEFVHGELLRIAGQCVPADVARFPALQERLLAAVEAFINQGAAPAERMIRDCVSCEHSYINTDHPGFIGGNRAIAAVLEGQLSSSDNDENEEPVDHRHPTKAGVQASPQRTAPAGSKTNSRNAQHKVESSAERSGRGAHAHSASAGSASTATAARPSARGLQPELYMPAELLAGRTASAGLPALPAPEAERDPTRPHTWFSNLFSGGGSGADLSAGESPQRDAGHPASTSALDHPPRTLRVPISTTDQEEVQMQVTRVLVESYFDIVRKNLQDAVPKAIMHFLVNAVARGLQQHLIATLYKEEHFDQLVREREDVAAKRQKCTAGLAALREALAALERLPAHLTARVNASSAYGSATPDRAASRDLGRPQRPNTAFIVRSSSGAGARLSQAARAAVTPFSSVAVPEEGYATGFT